MRPPPLLRRRSAQVPPSEPSAHPCTRPGLRIGNDAWRHALSFLSVVDSHAALCACAYFRALLSSQGSWGASLAVGGALPWRLTGECVARAPSVDAGAVVRLWSGARARRSALDGRGARGVPSEAEQWCSDAVVAHVAARCGARLEAVDLLGASRLTAKGIVAVARCPRLRFLGLAGACNHLNDAAMAEVAPHLAGLEHLDLSYCRQLTADGLRPALRAAGPTLLSLNLDGAYLVSDAAAGDVADLCPRVRELSMARCHITSAAVLRLAASCRTLERLDVSFVESVPAAAVRALVEGCPALREVGLEGCLRLGDDSVLELARAARLEDVNLRYCEFLSFASLGPLAESCPRLRHLNLTAVKRATNGVLEALARGTRGLRSLQLNQAGWLDDAAVAGLAALPLEELSLERCRQLTDEAVLPLAAAAVPLRAVNLSWTRRVTQGAVEALARGCGRTLRRVVLSGCARFGDGAVEAVAAHCPLLEELEAASLPLLSDRGAAAVAASLPRLRRLDVKACPLLTDKSMVAVAHGCTLVEYLAVSFCPGLTPRFAAAAAERMDRLRFLRCEGCDEAMVDEARRLRPGLFEDEEDEQVIELYGELFE